MRGTAPAAHARADRAITATTALGQVERAANRIYGVERDRPSVEKYGRAFVLAVSVGFLFAVAFVLLAFGRDIGAGTGRCTRSGWSSAGRPGLVLAGLALTGLLQYSRATPAEHVWLASARVGVLCWTVVTLTFGVIFNASSSFGDTYGPLAGIVALQLWSLFSAVSILFGAAVAAQLEAVRAGLPQPAKPDPEERREACRDGARDAQPS